MRAEQREDAFLSVSKALSFRNQTSHGLNRAAEWWEIKKDVKDQMSCGINKREGED